MSDVTLEPVADITLSGWAEFDRATGDDPYALYAEVRTGAPVRRVPFAGRHAWLISGYDEARQALTDPRLAKDLHRAEAAKPGSVLPGLLHPLTAHHMLSQDPPDHTRLRQLVSRAFAPPRMEALRPRVQAITDELLDGLERQVAAEPIDLVANFAFPLPIIVICELLGVPTADREQLRAWFVRTFENPLVPPAPRRRGRRPTVWPPTSPTS